jgi:putative transposase
LTEAVRIVGRVVKEVQLSAHRVCGPGCHFVWCPKFRRTVRTGRSAARCEELIRARADGHGWPVVALEIMPNQVHLFAKVHRSVCPPRVASQVKGFTSLGLRTGFLHLLSRLSARWSRSYSAATAGAVPAQAVCQYTGTQHGRRWRKEPAW